MFSSDAILEIGRRVLVGLGLTPNDAEIVANELRDANLVGHDSHGVMRLMQYAGSIRDGHMKPETQSVVLTETPSWALLDGQFQFGQVTMTHALSLGIEKASKTGTATVLVRNCNHVGRLGSYTERAAQQGYFCLMCVNAPGPGGVTPYGGLDRILGTNPISIAAPYGKTQFVLDMTTSMVAEGKVRVAFQKGEPIPAGWIIDAKGNPTTNPADLYGNPPETPPGALLPLGGELGFKGFGLSVMIDLLAGIVSGSGIMRTDLPRGANGIWLYLLDIKSIIPPAEYDEWIEKYVSGIKNSRKQPGVTEILLPGEIEQRRKAQRIEEGVSLPDETWRQIKALAESVKVTLDDLSP
ncbi:MAG: Ldh family oxidoreductase [Planctomycetota bacterium]|nr:Ldh family oxidoreductase [Planctomycetota bacterium]